MKNLEVWYWSRTEHCTYATYRTRIYDTETKSIIYDTYERTLTTEVATDHWRQKEGEIEEIVRRNNVVKTYETSPGSGKDPHWCE